MLKILSERDFKQKLECFKLGVYKDGEKIKEITAWNVFNTSTNYQFMTYIDISFFNPDLRIFGLFQEYEYEPIDTELFDKQIIRPFEEHIFNVICNKNSDVYSYLIKWFCFIFQNPSGKTVIVLCIIGCEGTGKTNFKKN